MRLVPQAVLAAAAVFISGISTANADIFMWQDPVTKVSVTAPDTWRRGNNHKSDDVLTLVAPGEEDYAGCRIRVRDDRRFMIYPPRYSGEIQRLNYSRAFWDDYLNEYDDVVLHSVTDNAGLGRGFASYAEASYTTATGPIVEKRAVIYAGLYNDKAYILECSAAVDAFPRLYGQFGGILKSVDFAKIIQQFPSGHYRNFMREGPLRINGARIEDVSHY